MKVALSEISTSSPEFNRLNGQAQLLQDGLVEESRAELLRTHTSLEDLFAMFKGEQETANRSNAGKEVRVKGEVGMFGTDQFDRPYITLHSKNAELSVQAILLGKH